MSVARERGGGEASRTRGMTARWPLVAVSVSTLSAVAVVVVWALSNDIAKASSVALGAKTFSVIGRPASGGSAATLGLAGRIRQYLSPITGSFSVGRHGSSGPSGDTIEPLAVAVNCSSHRSSPSRKARRRLQQDVTVASVVFGELDPAYKDGQVVATEPTDAEDFDDLWDLGRATLRREGNYKFCDPYAPLREIQGVQDVTHNPDTNTLWVVSARELNEYSVDGVLLRTLSLLMTNKATGVAYVSDGLFAVTTEAPPALAYFTVNDGSAGGLQPDSIHTTMVADSSGERHPVTLRGISYDPHEDILYAAMNEESQDFVSVDSRGTATVEQRSFKPERGDYFVGTFWSASRGRLFVLSRSEFQYNPGQAYELHPNDRGSDSSRTWSTSTVTALYEVSQGQGITFTSAGERAMIVSAFDKLYVYSPDDGCDSVNMYDGEGMEVSLDEVDELSGEPPFDPTQFSPEPYEDLISGKRSFMTTYTNNMYYDVGPFIPPQGPFPATWADECITNLKQVKETSRQRKERRPNEECPAGWFLCRGMCYTLVQRNNRGPNLQRGHQEYYNGDYMFVESRCGLCGKARVAFVGEDPDMERVAAAAAAETLNEDKAVWVRRFRFLEEPNPGVEKRRPYQAWHRYIEMINDNPKEMTYQRFYTGSKDNLRKPAYDARFRNQEGTILCVNTIDRISAAVEIGERTSRITWEGGCSGNNRHDKWDDRYHRWWPEDLWPYPGL